MSFRLTIQDEVVYQGNPVPVPRVGELITRAGEALPVESVTWDFGADASVTVTLAVGSRPYTF